MLSSKIYLDYAATTPLDKEVKEAMLPYWGGKFGNPSSIHSFGQEAQNAIDAARDCLAKFLNCSSKEIYFTSSATEANNWINSLRLSQNRVFSLFNSLKMANLSPPRRGCNIKTRFSDSLRLLKPHYLISSIEHKSVLEPVKNLAEKGLIELDLIPVNQDGLVEPNRIKEMIKENTVLVSVMAANNEVGTVQPIEAIGSIVVEFKQKGQNIYFHTDAVQAAQFINLDPSKLGVDYLTLSSHKIYGPKGIGGLYVKGGISLEPLFYGGAQERGKRAGTENVAAIVGFGKAVEILNNKEIQTMIKLRDYLKDIILSNFKEAVINGSWKSRLPNNLNISFPGLAGDAMVIALDRAGIAVSTGSACSAKAIKSSHVLEAMGFNEKRIKGSIRITLGKQTTEAEIKKAAKIFVKIIRKLT